MVSAMLLCCECWPCLAALGPLESAALRTLRGFTKSLCTGPICVLHGGSAANLTAFLPSLGHTKQRLRTCKWVRRATGKETQGCGKQKDHCFQLQVSHVMGPFQRGPQQGQSTEDFPAPTNSRSSWLGLPHKTAATNSAQRSALPHNHRDSPPSSPAGFQHLSEERLRLFETSLGFQKAGQVVHHPQRQRMLISPLATASALGLRAPARSYGRRVRCVTSALGCFGHD